MRRGPGAAALVVALLLASLAATGSVHASVPAGWNVCTNRALGFSIAYPPRWHTARLSQAGACLYFEPKPFRIPPNSDFTGTALEVLPTQQSYAGLVRTLTDPTFSRIHSRRRTTVAGRPATRLETVATGEGLLSRGTRTYAYVIDRGRRPAFIVQTTRAAGASWPARKRILDRAVRTLRFASP
jgi:hypothetical protein